MCKTGYEHAANENTHKPRVHTRHDNMKSRSQWNTQAACHTAQDMTWMHASDQMWTACNNTKHNTHGQKSELETACSHNETEHGAWVSEARHKTGPQDMSAGIRTPRSNTKQGTQTKPWAHIETGHDGSVRTLSQNHELHQTEMTEPWHTQYTLIYSVGESYF